ncbi:hypothetical protein PAXRUDRAFT_101449, partial [Paxillus rubicundulus Ve08.2h10]
MANMAIGMPGEQIDVVEKADVNVMDKNFNTPLHLACYDGHISIVELLLQKGAIVHAQGEYSGTPLRSACDGGHIDIVELLLRNGADANAQG